MEKYEKQGVPTPDEARSPEPSAVAASPQGAGGREIPEEELAAIFAIVRERTGHDVGSYKRSTVMRRIGRRMVLNDVSEIGRYVDLLAAHPPEAKELSREILIGVTRFFRDSAAFESLRREVLPRIFAGRGGDDPVRIWHACCSTGEEVYSLAILIQEYLEETGSTARVQFFATDLDESAIAHARAGAYAGLPAGRLHAGRLRKFFIEAADGFQVVKSLREMIVFAHHDLLKDPPFSRLDLLICRNCLIYFRGDVQKRLIPLFHQALRPGGFLFLGSAESIGRDTDLFAPVDKKWKIYERTAAATPLGVGLPPAFPRRVGAPERAAGRAADPLPVGEIVERSLRERYSPPCVVVNERYEVVYFSTRTSGLLEPPVGEPTRDLLKMAREELRPALRAAIHKVFSDGNEVAFRGLRLGGERAVDLLVEPVPGKRLVTVIFEPAAPVGEAGLAPLPQPSAAGESEKDLLIRQLEEQLRITHHQLQATIEQLETTNEGLTSTNEELLSINEEYQSTNEELHSTNEELETSKEELQSLNEELVTVNVELQEKVEELGRAGNDMLNLLASSKIATIFLDPELRVKRFTPATAAIYSLMPADIGRSLHHIVSTVSYPELPLDAAEVLGGLTFVEREVQTLEGDRCYLTRVFPYLTAGGGMDGVVVTFVDITERKRTEKSLREREEQFRIMFMQSSVGKAQADPFTGRFLRVNAALCRFTGYSEEELLQKTFADVTHPDDRGAELASLDDLADGRIESFQSENRYLRPDGSAVWGHVTVNMVRDAAGRPLRTMAVVQDITDRKRAEDALLESRVRVRKKLDSILAPEGDIGDLELADIIDAPSLQTLVDDFYALTGMPMGILDIKGRVLVGVGWQDTCTKFHRVHPKTCSNCLESDTLLSAGVPQGEYRVYRCRNNMWDVATPIIIGDRHFGNLFMGQFFFDDEQLDLELFRTQAKEYGFDEKEYLTALGKVPRLSRETLDTSMSFFMKLADMISRMSYSNLKLARSLAERDSLTGALRRSEEQLRIAALAGEVGLWSWAPGTSDVIVSANWRRLFGVAEDVEVTADTWRDALHPEDRERAVNALFGACDEGGEFNAEYRVVLPDGALRWISDRGRASCDESGRTILMAGVNVDTTQRKRYEKELLEARQAAEAANKTKTEFLAVMSHELRTPLSGIMGMTQLLHMTPLTEEQERYLGLVDLSSQNLLSLINDILDLARIEAGKLTLEKALFVLRDQVNDVVRIQSPALQQKELRLVVDIPGDLPQLLLGDSLRFRQILMNLLSNAIKFTDRGTITVSVRLAAREAGTATLAVSVTDTGIGMPEEVVRKIFAPFEQADMSTTRKYGGSGLGLAICRRLTGIMGGRIWAESVQGEGSVFSFEVPFQLPPELAGSWQDDAPAAEGPSWEGALLRVLLAEDDEVNRSIAQDLLESLGFRVTAAANGKEAVEAVAKEDYDVILMDIRMPVMDGLEALRRIRAGETRFCAGRPVIAVTANAMQEDRERYFREGFDAYLSKPYSLTQLVETLRRVTGREG